jgi:hypothetical protein
MELCGALVEEEHFRYNDIAISSGACPKIRDAWYFISISRGARYGKVNISALERFRSGARWQRAGNYCWGGLRKEFKSRNIDSSSGLRP